MKRAVVWFAVTLLALGTAAFGSTVSGYSGIFGINNTMGGPPPIPSYCGSPYGAGTVLLKGQLHCHSYPDDWALYDYSGTNPGSTLAKYQALGYDFLAVTDHNIVSPESVGWQGWAPNSVEITHGNWVPSAYENDTHVLAIGTSQGSSMAMLDYPHTGNIANDTAQRVQRVHGRSGLAFVAHPDSVPYNIGVNDLVQVYGRARMDGIGIWTPGNDSQRTWDKLVYALGRPVWGYVEDDYHPDRLSNGKKGRSWVAVPGSSGEWWGNIKEKLRNGNYYCYYTTSGKWPGGSTPPQMRVTVSNSGSQPVISVNFDRTVNSIEYYGYDWGFFKKLKSPVSGSSDSYQANGREKFVRVMARYEFSGGTLWMTSQPIVVNKNGNFSPYYAAPAPGEYRAMSTSSGLILNYVDADAKPLPPAAGYVGDVYDVTTGDGQVPPGATLQLSYAGEDIGPLGGTQYLAIYRYDDPAQQWVTVGGTVDPGAQTIESPISALGKYCISADLPADTTAPQVFIDNPPYAASVAADTTVRATVNDDLGAWRVKFYMNDHLLGEDAYGGDGWSADIKIADYCTGDWTLKAVAEDLAGNSGSVEMPIYIVSLTPRPTVAIASPATGSALTGTVTASGTCGDDVAVASVMIEFDDTVVGFADVDGGNWTCDIDTGLLVNGVRSLKAVVEDYPGNEATASVSVTINNATVSVAGAKLIADGGVAGITGLVATAGTAEIGGAFYVEDAGRFAGLRVSTDKTIAQGDMVSASGLMSTVEGERILAGADVLRLSSSNPLPKAMAMAGRNVAGGMAGFIPGVSGYPHLSNVGLLVCTWGRVTQKGDGYLYLDDGSCQPDGTLTGAEPNVGIRVHCDPTAYNTGDLLFVTGISSCFDAPDGLIARRILTRTPDDVRKVYP